MTPRDSHLGPRDSKSSTKTLDNPRSQPAQSQIGLFRGAYTFDPHPLSSSATSMQVSLLQDFKKLQKAIEEADGSKVLCYPLNDADDIASQTRDGILRIIQANDGTYYPGSANMEYQFSLPDLESILFERARDEGLFD